jgi:predicted ribonuclease toxin of YeeF-YezG toxin-antitoxin module
MQLKAAKQTADIAKGIGVGLYDVGKDFVTGVWDIVTDPGETVEGVANSIMHPIKTYKYISKSISDSYERDMVNGDAYSRAHWVSYALGTVVTSVVGTKGAGAVAKTGAATTKAAAVKGATKAKELVSIPNLLPYNPKNQLSLAGGVPYNVVNGVGLKDQLISMAKVESEVSGRGVDIGTYRHFKEYENNKYFTRIVEYNAGKLGTGFTYKVYQRSDINWDMVRTRGAKKGRGLTNAEASAKYGLAPILDDAGSVATLHHSQQKGIGPLFEASTRYHNISNAKRAPLHPYKGKLNPYFPMDEGTREAFQKVDSINYWKTRGKEALGGN